MIAVDFFSMYTFGQWIVVSIIGMAGMGLLAGVVGWVSTPKESFWGHFLAGAVGYLGGLFLCTLVVWTLSLFQWLWNL